MKKLNKVLFGLGSIGAVVAPVVAVVACDNNDPVLDIVKASENKDTLLSFAKEQKLVNEKNEIKNWDTFIKKYENSASVAEVGQRLEDKMVKEFNLIRDTQNGGHISGPALTKDQAKQVAEWVNKETTISPTQRTFMWFDLIGEESVKALLAL